RGYGPRRYGPAGRPPSAAGQRYSRAPMTASKNDPSRFVLAEEAPYLANLAALWTADPALAAEIEALHGTPSYKTQPSKAGPPTVAVLTPGGRSIFLHSR